MTEKALFNHHLFYCNPIVRDYFNKANPLWEIAQVDVDIIFSHYCPFNQLAFKIQDFDHLDICALDRYFSGRWVREHFNAAVLCYRNARYQVANRSVGTNSIINDYCITTAADRCKALLRGSRDWRKIVVAINLLVRCPHGICR